MTDLATRIVELSPEKLRQLNRRLAGPASPHQLPQIVPAPDERHLPFPLTDIQQAYWIGRQQGVELGNVSAHSYMELESKDLELDRFESAWRKLIAHHDMLRAIILPDGRQQILSEVPLFNVAVLDLREEAPEVAEERLAAVRAEMSHHVLPADCWPLFEIRASLLAGGRIRLHFSFDILLADIWSFRLLMRDLASFYRHPDLVLPPIALSFRDYVLAEREVRRSEPYRRSQAYWRERLPGLPPAPEVPMVKSPSALSNPRFARRRVRLDREIWSVLKARASRFGLTPSGLLLAAYSEVLATWSKSPRFTLNLTLFNRFPLHPEVNRVVGDFTSLNLLAVDVDLAAPFAERARRVQDQLWRDLEHSYVNGVQLLRELAALRGDLMQARMPVVFTSSLGQEERSEPEESAFIAIENVYSISQTPQVWLDHQVSEEAGALIFNWDAVEELFPPGMLDDMFAAYCGLLRRLAEREEIWTEAPQSVVPEHQRLRHAEANATAAPLPEGLLHEGFRAQAAASPDRPAVIAGDRVLTYGELARRSRALGRRLRLLGAQPNELVAVVAEKGWEQVVGVLGALESGAAYLPIEAGVPGRRLQQLLEQGRSRWAVTTGELAGSLDWPPGIERVLVDEEPGASGEEPLEAAAKPEDLAYVIFTSGSTGEPKGVMIEHRAALNTVADVNRRFAVGAQDRVLALSSLSFDLSVYDLFGVLSAGGAVVMPEPWAGREPGRWRELMAAHGVTLWNSVPPLLEVLADFLEGRGERLAPSLRLTLLSGDWIPLSLPDRVRSLAPGVEVVSLGGATEGSIWSILYRIGEVDPQWRSIPYGRAMMNQRMEVLGEALEERPDWVAGQLYIGGVGLARGYWGQDERTRERFLVHPRTGERLYRTGDLARWLPDGTMEFLGREDFQVKVQGYRIELGEIEAVLTQHPQVRSGVVTAVGEPQGTKRLVAYVVAEGGRNGLDEELRAHLAARLPGYMVPTAFVFLESLPLTPTGKVNRKALPAPAQSAEAAPSEEDGALSAQIARVITQVLDLDRVGLQTNLLDLGANSVDLIRIANQLERELGFRPKLEDFFRTPTVAGLAQLHERERAEGRGPAEPAAPPPGVAPRWAVDEPLRDPEERERFKERRLGLRPVRSDEVRIPLDPEGDSAAWIERSRALRSDRRFSSESIPLARFARFLECLREGAVDGHPKFLYPSAGGLYPLQVYLHVKAGRIEGLTAGTYYYHPAQQTLVLLSEGVELDRAIHGELINRPIFDSCAFSVFLIAQAAAIVPLYGHRARDFCLLEAGAMLQLLREAAADCGLGACCIGGLDFDAIRPLFALDDSHELMHSLLGGVPAGGAAKIRSEVTADLDARRREPVLRPVPRDGELPLSSPQRRLWFLDQLDPGNSAYNVFGMLRLTGALDVGALSRTLDEIVRRHEVLRTTFPAVDGQPRQVIAPPGAVAMSRLSLSALPAEVRERQMQSLISEEASRPFDLARGPLLRAALVELGPADHLILFTMHHIVSDAWSRGILATELGQLYSAFVTGRPSPLSDPLIQYADFAHWQQRCLQGDLLAEQIAYWRRQLAGAPTALALPTRQARSGAISHRGARQFFSVPGEIKDRLHALARREDATFFMVLLAAFQALLSIHSGQKDVMVGTPITNRRKVETEGLIGFFVNTLVMRGDLAGDPTFMQFLGRVRRVVLDGFANQDAPFELILDALRPDRSLGRNPIFQAWFVLQNVPMPTVALPGLELRGIDIHSGAVRHDLKLDVTETGDGLRGFFEFKTDLFGEAIIDRLCSDLPELLRIVSESPEVVLSDIESQLAAYQEKRKGEQGQLLREARRQKLRGLLQR